MALPVVNNDICLSSSKFYNYIFFTSSPYEYMVCENGISSVHTCPPDSIFVPGKKCADIYTHNITIGKSTLDFFFFLVLHKRNFP